MQISRGNVRKDFNVEFWGHEYLEGKTSEMGAAPYDGGKERGDPDPIGSECSGSEYEKKSEQITR